MSMNPPLVHALRVTARRLASPDAPYRWTHQGHCNCGHLAQTLTEFGPAHIHAAGLEAPGDWSEHARDYCPTSGLAVDAIIARMLDAGLTPEDLIHLERLSDPRTLSALPEGQRDLDYRRREDVVRYLELWAERLARD
jgi:hypothetical protein